MVLSGYKILFLFFSFSSVDSTKRLSKKPALTLMAHASPRPCIVEFNKLVGTVLGMKDHAIVVSVRKQMELLGISRDAYTLNFDCSTLHQR
ncbi:hypothetical protein V6Z11_D04G026700 [Gossypium hirsutum]